MVDTNSPIGTSVTDDRSDRRARSSKFRQTEDRLGPFEELGRVVIMRRAQLGLAQQDLADRMGTSKSVVPRIERGQHRSSPETLRRLAQALEGRAVIGFEFDSVTPTGPGVVRL